MRGLVTVLRPQWPGVLARDGDDADEKSSWGIDERADAEAREPRDTRGDEIEQSTLVRIAQTETQRQGHKHIHTC